MKKLMLAFGLFFTAILFANITNAQTYTTVSKSCGSCGGSVSEYSRTGQRCPHCGVIWGQETTKRSSRTTTKIKYNNDYDNDNMYQSSNTITNCNLRSAPNAKATIMGVIAKNESITITQRKGDWVKISFFGSFMEDGGYSISYHVGWVHVGGVVL
jgi:predicted RNA-binding Zn-ribbon protein involved in translation (DUF1610 family)